jgi:error-prone DNA polymerase
MKSPRRTRFLQLLPGAEFLVQAAYAFRLVVLPHNAAGWGNLCEFITEARRPATCWKKAATASRWARPISRGWVIAKSCCRLCPMRSMCRRWAHTPPGPRACSARSAWLAVELLQGLDDALRLQQLQEVAARTGIRLVAAGNVLMHKRSRKPLHDVMTAVKLGKTVHECGFALQANAEAHLRPRMRLAGMYPAALLRATLEVAARCSFNLDEIRNLYRYPQDDMVPPAETPARWLRRLTWQGAQKRYARRIPHKIAGAVGFELALIEELEYEMFFITVHDIVRFANEKKILCQGRGSAANSAVCFCLGVTAINPAESKLLFERFISRERSEPPDIDVDFEHERREEVIQYIYGKYGHDRAAIAATVISYRPRSAIRDAGKALGMAPELIDQFAKEHFWFDGSEVLEEKIRQAGLAGKEAPVLQWLDLSAQLIGFPRHLSQHVGGFVLTQGKLTRLVPVQPASMEDRRIIQWDKDDLEAMGLLKVDVLALGMLSAIRRCLALVNQTRGSQLGDAPDPPDEKTYDMICEADTVGVFQIESRAQMSMLPRLQPRSYYDLVVEVAIVRPGPIQGGMVHPYLKNREIIRNGGQDQARIPGAQPGPGAHAGHPDLPGAGDADRDDRRRLHARRGRRPAPLHGGLEAQGRGGPFPWPPGQRHGQERLQRRVFRAHLQPDPGLRRLRLSRKPCRQFCQAGLRELLVQVPRAGLLPGGHGQFAAHGVLFTLATGAGRRAARRGGARGGRDAQRMGLHAGARPTKTLPQHPAYPGIEDKQPAVRLGLRLVSGLREEAVTRLVAARTQAPFTSTEDLVSRARLGTLEINALAAADALLPLSGHRRQQVWDASAIKPAPRLLKSVPTHETPLALPDTPEGENILFDYQATGLTLRRHPVALLRERLSRKGLLSASELNALGDGEEVAGCGIVTVRQQPQTAKGTIFITLEDETGPVNVIVWKSLREAQRAEVLHARLLAVYGVWQRSEESGTAKGYGAVRNLVAHRLEDLTPLLGRLGTSSRDFH